jgi:enoyl-CoA hydratase
MNGIEVYRCGWASAVYPAGELEEQTEAIARQIALTDTDLIMLTKRSINRQLEIMGFRTGMHASAEFLALATRRPSQARGGAEFNRIAREQGLKAALDWRDRAMGISYRTARQRPGW